MIRKIVIVEIETEKTIATDHIHLTGVNYDPQDSEWFDLAWSNAVSDGLVSKNERAKHKIAFA